MALKRPKTKQTKAAADPARVAIFSPRRVKDSVTHCDVLVVALTGARIECVAAQSWEGASCLEDAHGWAAEQLASRTVMLLDGAEVISRTMALPPASPDQLEMALRLQVENVLLGGAARWRAGAAVLPSNDPDRERVALMVDWPAASDGPQLPTCFGDARDVLYAPPIAALAALTLASIARGSHESMCLLLQRESGGISLAYSNGIKIALRTALENGTDLSAWKEAVARTVAESLMMLELPDAAIAQTMTSLREAIDRQPDGLLLPCGDGWSAMTNLASGVGNDREWQQRFGVALGCAVALTSSLARLLSLRLRAEAENAQWWLRMLRAMERPSVAAKLGVAALLALALVPMGVARGRLAYLEWQVPDQKYLRAQIERADKERQIYEQIHSQATPMTKLLGDLASCTPEGIEVTGITIDQQGQQSKVEVQAEASRSEGSGGTKEPFQLVNLMQQWLRESKVFEKIEKSTEKADSNGLVSFNLTMTVKDPVRVPAYKAEQDFAAKSLRERRYGPPPADPTAAPTASAPIATAAASGTANGPPAVTEDATTGEASPPVLGSEAPAAPAAAADAVVAADSATRRSTAGSGRAPGAARTRERSAESSKPAIPPPLTEAQIGSMTEAEAKEAVGRIATAKNAAGLDEETRDRLKREFEAVMRRLREVKK